MMENWWYAIIERSHGMAVIHTGYGAQDSAWRIANYLGYAYSDMVADYDVLFFENRKKMIEFIIKDAKERAGVK